MSECPSLPTCPFFNDRMKALPGVGELYKQQFCKGRHEECARFRVSSALGSRSVPVDLYPTQQAKADALISTAKH